MAFLRLDLWICVPFFEDSALQETMYFMTFDWEDVHRKKSAYKLIPPY